MARLQDCALCSHRVGRRCPWPELRGAAQPTRTRSPRIVQARAPKEIVGWTSNRDLEVVSTTTGAVERTLASNVALFAPGVPTLSVSPGGVVFFDWIPMVGISPPDAQGDQIYSVSIVGGPVHEVSPGYDPAISPDGRTLAFVASNGVGEAPYQLANGGIELAQLNGSEITGVRTLHPSGTMVGAGFSNLSWSAGLSDALVRSTRSFERRHQFVVDQRPERRARSLQP